ncbi:unnamed protein product [Prunus armeniaca]
MSDSESFSEREPNAFDEESSDGLFDSDVEAVGPDAEEGSDTDVEILGERPSPVPTHGIGKGLMTAPVPLSIVYSDGRHVGLGAPGEASGSHQPEASTSGRGEAATEPSVRPRVSVVYPGNPRVPMGVPKELVFGVDYLEPNRITEREIAKFRAEYFIPDSVGMRIPLPIESLSSPKDGEVVFFTDVLLQGVRLPLQPAVQRILAQIGYAPGQFNPNFWVALMGVVTAFGMAGEGEPSYEQFSHLYSITKSKCADHGGWVQANCLKAAERGHFVNAVPTSQKTWRKRRVLLSGDWESPSGHPVRFHIPTTFQIAGRLSCRSVGLVGIASIVFEADTVWFCAGKLKQPSATQAEIRQIERVRLKVPAVERVYPKFLFTANLIKARLVNPAEMTEERKAAEVKRMNESSKRRLMLGMQGKKKSRQASTAPTPSGGVDPDDLTLNERRRQMQAESARAEATEAGPSPGRVPPTEGTSSRAAGKRPFTVDVDADPAPKRGQQTEPARAVFSAEDNEAPSEAVTLACPSKTVQFVTLACLQASASMDMWLCVKRAINAAEKAKKLYEDGRAKVAEAGKAIQAQANLAKDMQAAERQVKVYQAKLGEMSAALEAAQLTAKEALESKEAIQVAFEESERARASEIEFSTLLDKEVGSEMADLLYRFKRYNPGKKLNLNFIADPPPLPEGITEEMIEEYEGEDATEEVPAEPEGITAEADGAAPDADEAAA